MRALNRLAVLAVLLVLPACRGDSPVVPEPPAPSPEHSANIVYEVDAEVVRALGWVAPEASDAEAARAVAGRIEGRVRTLLDHPGFGLVIQEDRVVLQGLEISAAEAADLDRALRGMGTLELAIVAEPSDELFPPHPLDEAGARLRTWREDHPGGALADYVLVPFGEGGLHPGLIAATRSPENPWGPSGGADDVTFLLRPHSLRASFTAADFERVEKTVDSSGFPALAFEFVDVRKNDFLDFTERHRGRRMAILVDGMLHAAPTIDEPLPGGGIIRGQFTEADVDEMVCVLRTDTLGGPLRLLEIYER